MKQFQALFANLICKFDRRNLLDFASELVLPALLDDSIVRTHGRTSYSLRDMKVTNFGSRRKPDVVVYGRFVKDMYLHRTQFLDDGTGELVQDEDTLQSSPSAFFVLYLADHKVVYLAETPAAPSIENFEATLRYVIRAKRKKLIENAHQESQGTDNPITLKHLGSKVYPFPSIDLVPLSSEASLAEFVDLFEVLRKVEVTILERNDEFDASQLAEGLNEFNKLLEGQKTKLTTSSTDGLNLAAAKEQLVEMVKTGNQIVKLTGVSEDEEVLVGTNKEFSVRAEVPHVELADDGKAKQLHTLMLDHQNSDALPTRKDPDDKTTDAMKEIIERYEPE